MAIQAAYNIHQKNNELAIRTQAAGGQMFQCPLSSAFLSLKIEFLLQVAMSRNMLLEEIGGQAGYQPPEVIRSCVGGASLSAPWHFPLFFIIDLIVQSEVGQSRLEHRLCPGAAEGAIPPILLLKLLSCSSIKL